MREICCHAVIINRINLHKPNPFKLHNVPKFFYHHRFTGTANFSFLREKGAGYSSCAGSHWIICAFAARASASESPA